MCQAININGCLKFQIPFSFRAEVIVLKHQNRAAMKRAEQSSYENHFKNAAAQFDWSLAKFPYISGSYVYTMWSCDYCETCYNYIATHSFMAAWCFLKLDIDFSLSSIEHKRRHVFSALTMPFSIALSISGSFIVVQNVFCFPHPAHALIVCQRCRQTYWPHCWGKCNRLQKRFQWMNLPLKTLVNIKKMLNAKWGCYYLVYLAWIFLWNYLLYL